MLNYLSGQNIKALFIYFFISLSLYSFAQTSSVTLCESPNLFVSNGLSLTPGINFSGSVPVGNLVTDIRVSVTWSRRQTNCAGANGTDDVSEVEMSLVGPSGISRILVGPGGSWTGTGTVNSFTTSFRDGASNIIGFPNNGSIYNPATSLASVLPSGTDFLGSIGAGLWRLEIVDNNANSTGICIQSYCITIISCAAPPLIASCRATALLKLDTFGLRTPAFSDLNLSSDTSCLLSTVRFSLNASGTPLLNSPFNCSNAGTTFPLYMVLTDKLGRSAICPTPTSVTVRDSVAPDVPECRIFSATADTVYLNAAGVATYNVSQLTPTDACGISTVQISNGYNVNFGNTVTFNCSPNTLAGIHGTGANNLYARVRDVNNNFRNSLSLSSSFYPSCRIRILAFDTIPPNAICHPTRTLTLASNGLVSATSATIDNGSFASCAPSGPLLFTINNSAAVTYTCDSIGSRTAFLIVTKNNSPQQGGISRDTCTTIINVVDVTPPNSICSGTALQLSVAGSVTVAASTIAAFSSDNCATMSYSFSTGLNRTFNCSNLGVNVATVSVTDGSGNVSTCNASITVTDVTAPVANCQNINAYLNGSGTVNIPATSINNSSTDACGISSYLINGLGSVNYSCDSVGVRNVRLTVSDASSNSNSCNATVTVIDTIRPNAICQNKTVYLSSSGLVTVSVTEIDNASTDNCSILSRTINGLSPGTRATYTCDSIGSRTAILQINDVNGNSRTCTATVQVLDSIRPTAVCRNINAFLGATGTVSITAAQINNGSTDNCAVTNYQLSTTSFSCDSIGTRNVTLQASDASGNNRTCSATVTVQDTTRPVAQCQNVTLILNAIGNASLTTADINNSSSDNCSISSFQFSGLAVGANINYNCDSTGTRTAILRVNDQNGNFSTCNATVTVSDTTRPIALCQNIVAHLNSAGAVTVNALQLNNGSSDICGINTYFINNSGNLSQTYNCTNIGPNSASFIVVDKNGNTNNCLATIEIRDTVKPSMTCLNTNVYLNPSGFAVISPSTINNGSSDACGFASLSVSSDTVRCANIGSLNVRLRGTDVNGNTDSCTAVVTVIDTVAPLAICTNTTVYLNSTGTVAVMPIDVNNGSSDICNSIFSIKVNGLDSVIFSCSNSGVQTVLLQIFDTNGNVGSCSAQVTVIDSVKPTAICGNITLPLDASGNLSLSAGTINNGSSDACGINSFRFNNGSSIRTFNCTNIGSNNISLLVTDANGNTDSCTSVVTLQDLIAPNALCQATSVYLNNLGVISIQATQINAGSNDACGIDTMFVSPANFNCNSISTPQNITLTVIDNNNNSASCQATVNVIDSVRPSMICSNPTVYLDALGVVSVSPLQIDGGSNDACGIVQRLINGNNNQVYTCANLGLNNALLGATDLNNNSANCNSLVTVVDTVLPIARCYAPFNVFLNNATGTATLTPIMVDSSSSDNCSLNTSIFTVNNQPSINYTCANAGLVQNITLRVFDGSNQSSTCTTTITVRDTTRPIAQCLPSITRTLSAASPASVNVSAISLNNNSTDVCGAATLSYFINGQPSFSYTCANLGPNTATLTVQDQNGNQSTCTSVVIINDITPPIASCVANYSINLDANGQATLTGAVLNNGSADNCSVSSFLVNGAASQIFTCSNFGSSAVTLTVRDASGNSSTCTSLITVQDTSAPVARCFTNPIEVFLNPATGTATVLGTLLDSLSNDNCIISTRLVNNAVSASFSCTNIGLNNVTLTVRDQANNAQSCNAQVFVRDTVLPVANCQNINAILNTSGLAFVNATQINASSSDNCIISSYLINGQTRDTFDCTNIGSNVVTLTVTDNSGNESFCQSTITVIDNIAPNVSCTNRTVYLDAAGSVIVPPNAVGSATDICGVVNYTIDNLPFRTYSCANANTTFSDTIRGFDASGNPGTCVAQITVSDTIRPVASCINRTISLDSSGVVTVLPSQINLNSTDNCGTPFNLLINNQPNITYNCNNVGTNNVTLRVADASGNFSTCTAQVTVVDNIAPIARCRNLLTVQLDASGNATIQAINLDAQPGSYDACAPLSYTVNGQSTFNLNCTNLNGTNTVFLTVTDIHGNASTCSSSINVIDVNPPVINCTNYTLQLDITGNASLLSQNVINTALSTDNCNTINYTIDGSLNSRIYNCNDIGLNTVTVVGSDPSGNRDTCFASVTVVDTVAPTVNCQSIVVNLTYSVVDTLTLLDLGVSSVDACGVDTTVFFPNIITCANLGSIPVTITSYDFYGNAATCISQVNVVLDGAQPSAIDSFLCEGQPLQLYANPPATGFTYDYVWAGPSFSSNTQNPQIGNMQGVNEGNYIVTIIPQGLPGCVVSDTVFIDVNVVPPPIITMDGLACFGDSITFYFANQAAYSGTNFSYQWLYEGIPAGSNSSTFIIDPVAFSDTGAYSAIVNIDGCADTSLVPLDLVVFALPDAFTPTANSPCLGDTLTLFANPPTTSPYVYSWSGPIGFSSTTRDPFLPFVFTNNSGLYQVTITDQNTCQRVETVLVTVKELPDIPALVYNDPLCINDVLVLNDTVIRDPNTFFIWDESTFIIDTTTTPQVFLVSPVEGEYGVYVVENGCISQRVTVNVVFELEPGAFEDAYNVPFRDSLTELEVTLNDAVRDGFAISIVDSANNGTVSINGNGTLNYVPNFNYQGIDSFVYEICDPVCTSICDRAVVLIDVQYGERCFIPNALSPNGDGINDELLVVCRELYPNMKVQIYSRWGNLVFQGEPNGWDGMYNGANLPDGAYFYVLDFGDGSNPESGYLVISR